MSIWEMINMNKWVVTLTDEVEYRGDWVTMILGPFDSEDEATEYALRVLPTTEHDNKGNWDVRELEDV